MIFLKSSCFRGVRFFQESFDAKYFTSVDLRNLYARFDPAVVAFGMNQFYSQQQQILGMALNERITRGNVLHEQLLFQNKMIRRQDNDARLWIPANHVQERKEYAGACFPVGRLHNNIPLVQHADVPFRIGTMIAVDCYDEVIGWNELQRSRNGMRKHGASAGENTELFGAIRIKPRSNELVQPLAIATGKDDSPYVVVVA